MGWCNWENCGFCQESLVTFYGIGQLFDWNPKRTVLMLAYYSSECGIWRLFLKSTSHKYVIFIFFWLSCLDVCTRNRTIATVVNQGVFYKYSIRQVKRALYHLLQKSTVGYFLLIGRWQGHLSLFAIKAAFLRGVFWMVCNLINCP
jgi:hypothetical protein